MPLYRATIFFESGKYGWSETYFQPGANHQAILTKATSLALSRVPLLGTGVSIPYIRVSDDAIKRDALVAVPKIAAAADVKAVNGKPGTLAMAPAVATPADQPYSAILIRMNSDSPLNWRMMYLRGAPDSIIVNPAGPVPDGGWQGAFNSWCAELFASGWGFKGLDTGDDTNPKKAVGAVTATGPFSLTVAGHGLVNGDRVRVSEVKGLGQRQVNGVWTVDAVDANTIRLRNSTGSFTYDRGGVVRKIKYAFYAFSTILIRGETHRDTGRPFDSPRGRRPNRLD